MTRSSMHKTRMLPSRAIATLTAAALALLALAAPARPAALVDEPGIIAYVHMDNPKALVTELDAVGAKVGQSVSALLPLFGGNFLKSPGLAGIDMGAPMTLLVTMDEGDDQPGMSFVVTTTSPEAYFSTFGQSFTSTMKLDPATEKEPVRTYIEEVIEFDHEGHMAAVERGETPAIEDYQTKSTNTFYVATKGNAVIVASKQPLAERFLASDSVIPATRIVPGKMIAGARMEPVREMIRGPLAMVTSAIAMQAGGGMPPDIFVDEEEGETAPPEEQESLDEAADPAALAAAQVGRMMEALVEGLDQVEKMQLGLDLKDLTMDMHVGMQAAAGSELASLLSAARPVDRAVLTALPKETAIAGAARLGDFKPIMSLYFGMFGIEDKELIADYMKLMDEWQAVTTGTFSYGLVMRDGKPAGMAGVMGTRDSGKMREMIRQWCSKEGGVADLAARFMRAMPAAAMPVEFKPEDMEMKLTENVASVAGAPVDELSMSKDLFEKMFQGEEVPAEAKAMFAGFAELFGTYCYAYMPDRVLMASGAARLDLIREMAGAAAGPGAPGLQQTLAFAPADASGIMHLPLGPYMDLITGMMPTGEVPPQLDMVRQMMADVVLSGYMAASGNTARLGMRYPLGTILDMVGKTMAAEGGAMP